MDFCMTLPGGGPFHLNPGQLTDGGEMAMCLMNGLIANEESDTLDLRLIVEQYRKWIGSEPFDIDETVNSTLGLLSDPERALVAPTSL